MPPAPTATPLRTTPVVDPMVDPTSETEEPKVAHITRKEDSTRGYVEGTPIEALCGLRFVPTRNPDGLPVCEACRSVLDMIVAGRDGLN